MSLRDEFPKARVSASHYFLTLSRGEKLRCFALKAWQMWTFATLVPAVAALYLGGTAYLVFRDDMLAALIQRQNEMQFAYEDRLAAMRTQIDRVTSRQLLDQDSVEGKVQNLVARQAQLENRATLMAMLAENAGILRDATASIPRTEMKMPVEAAGKGGKAAPATTASQKSSAPNAKNAGPAAPQLPPSALGFAPLGPAAVDSIIPLSTPKQKVDAKPRPEGLEIGKEAESAPAAAGQRAAASAGSINLAADADLPLKFRLGSITTAMDRLEQSQVNAVSSIGGAAKRTAQRLKTVLTESGLPAEKLTRPAKSASGVGGPFVPMKLDPKASPFEAEVARLQDEMLAADSLRRVLPYLPLRTPLARLDQTSTFGARTDPFLGRMAMHTGLDFREAHGSPVYATAAGVVESAGYSGGYGNMVDIDHGNGVVTRYGHMSAILVTEGQVIRAGEVVGRLGSTGRSTGPHLHYEVRINDDPVDPSRFLKAGAKLFGPG